MITLGLVDDEPLFTTGLAMILDAQPDMRVAWQAGNGGDAIRQQALHPTDILLVDIQMPDTDGLTATRQLAATGEPGRVFILTTYDVDEYVPAAIEAGASGFLLKNTPPDQLIDAIRTVHRGDAIISPGPTRKLFDRLQWQQTIGEPAPSGTPAERRVLDLLTDRETQVLRLIAQGLTNQEICDQLWLSMPTVKTHVGNLIAKTQARDRVQLVLFALQTHLIGIREALATPQVRNGQTAVRRTSVPDCRAREHRTHGPQVPDDRPPTARG